MQTSKNMNTVLLHPLATASRHLDVFVSVTAGHANVSMWRALESWRPVRMTVYIKEPSDIHDQIRKVSANSPASLTAEGDVLPWARQKEEEMLLRRFRWKACWQNILEEERSTGTQYDFVLAVNPDLLLDPVAIHPDTWELWRRPQSSTARGLCKCGDAVANANVSTADAPVEEALLVAPRRVAERFMTSWDRLVQDVGDDRYSPNAVAQNCTNYKGREDYFPCLTAADLHYGGFGIQTIDELTPPEFHTPSADVEGCSVSFSKGGWLLFRSLPPEVQRCFGAADIPP